MAEASANRLTLRVVSPSLPSFELADLPSSTSIADVKSLIATQEPGRPSPAQQRLIYRGHPLLQPEQTLLQLFGQSAIDDGQALTIHLVTPPSDRPPAPRPPAPSVSRPETAPRPQNSEAPPNAHGGASNDAGPGQPPFGVPAIGPGGIMIPTPNGMLVGQPMQMPPQLQQNMMQLQMMQAQMANQLAAQNANLGNPPMDQQLFQQHMQQLEQQRRQNGHAPAPGPMGIVMQFGPNGSRVMPLNPGQPANVPASEGQAVPAQPIPGLDLLAQTLNNAASIPNSSQFPNAPSNSTNTAPAQSSEVRATTAPAQSPAVQHPMTTASVQSPSTDAASSQNLAAQNTPTAETSNVPASEPLKNPSNSAPDRVIDSSSNSLAIPRVSSNVRSPAESIPRRDDGRNKTLSQDGDQVEHDRLRAKAFACYTDSTRSVYLLSSPDGPKALLLAPEGRFEGSLPEPQVRPSNVAGPSSISRIRGLFGQDEAPPREEPRVAAPAQGQELRDFLRVLMPLGGHLWLLVRLAGFVWFFSHGASNTRTLILASLAAAVFLAQTGIFTPVLTQVWSPLRRYYDSFVPGNQAPRTGNPDPAETARRLLAERQARDVPNRIFRGVERLVALFVASLVPGVGEQHVRAQAELDRQREEEAAREQQAAEAEPRPDKGKRPMTAEDVSSSSSSS